MMSTALHVHVGATAAAQAFFSTQLVAFIKLHGGSGSDSDSVLDMNQWRVQVQTQLRGLSAGFVTVFYHRLSPPRKFKSRVEVAMDLGVFPFVRTIRAMPRSLQYLVAEETRERVLVAQRITAHDDPDSIEEFFIDTDSNLIHAKPCPSDAVPKIFNAYCFPLVPNAKVRSDDEREADKEVRTTVPETLGDHHRTLDAIREFGHTYGFAYGNTCIVDFGQIVPSGHFHNRDHLYPLGLKFVRQEHDTVSDRVVDCVCEIDCILHSKPDVYPLRNTTYAQLDAQTRADLRPLFRVTVAWDVGYGQHAIRVYEGKSPQLVWQSVLLEPLGTPGNDCAESSTTPLEDAMNKRLTQFQTDEDLVIAKPDPLEPMDEEERRLRAEVIELRRLHMRALSAGQEKGEMQAVKPRLALAHVNQFFDVGLLPLFEGMPGTEQCLGYHYIDIRTKETNKTVLLKNLSRMQTKMRALDKVAAKFASERVTALLHIKKEQKREAAELSKLQKKEEKKRKTERSQQMVERRNRARDLDKAARLMRDEAARAVVSRRQQAKFRVELLAKEEENRPELNDALAAVMREFENKDKNKDAEKEKEKEKIEEVVTAVEEEEVAEEDEEEDDKTIPRFSKKPLGEESSLRLPFGTPLHLPAETFGKAMELWQFVVTYADVLGVIAVPTEKHFETALSICDPSFLNVQGIINRVESQLLGRPRPRDEDEPVNDAVEIVEHPARVKTRRVAKDMLTKLAILLCKPLMAEYNRLMLIEAAEPYLGGLELELNELTWKDVARVVLTSTLCRHSGLSDHEVMSCIRGRGHLTAPDVSDRRVLRLAKRRMWFRYSQHLYRNQPDTTAIITPQNKSTMDHDVYRQHMLMHNYIGLGADFSGGLVLRITTPAVFEEDELDIRSLATSSVGGSPAICPEHQPQLVAFWCQLYTQLVLFREDVPFASIWMVFEVTSRLLEFVLHQGRYNKLHLSAWQVLQLCRAPAARSHGHLYPQVVFRVLRLILRRLLETATLGADEKMRSLVQGVLQNINTNPCRVNATCSPDVIVDVASKKLKEYDRPSPLQLYRSRKEVRICAPITEFITDKNIKQKEGDTKNEGDDDDMDVDEGAVATAKEDIKETDYEELEMDKFQEEEHDRAALLLSVAEQRLYRALKHLMYHAQAVNFNMAVDGDVVKGYYAFIRNPLCLFDILVGFDLSIPYLCVFLITSYFVDAFAGRWL